MTNDSNLGWVIDKEGSGSIAGSYLHGILENSKWRRSWLNNLRRIKGLKELPDNEENYQIKREKVLDKLAYEFEKHINIENIFELN